MIRKIFFWLHLAAGSLAGLVILVMSVTGVLLAWQRQIIQWSDRDFRPLPRAAGSVNASPEALLAKVAEAKGALPTALTMHSDPGAPAAAEFGRDSIIYMDPGTGQVLGEGSRATRAFFRGVEDWHRWLAVGLASRSTGRGITGAANLLFLGLLLSGPYLWLPKKWTRQHLRPAIWFRRGLRGKARDWNWHNTIGIWCVPPLLVIVLSGVVMSYPWATDLIYRATGTRAETQNGGGGRGGGRGSAGNSVPADVSLAGLDSLWRQAESQAPGWKSISVRTPASPRAPVRFTIDAGDGGRPDLRGQLALNRKTGEIASWEPFSSYNAGRRLRTWLRFSHTGEAGGIPGETLAAVASLGAAFLVWTGLSLAIRRMAQAIVRVRRRADMPVAEVSSLLR
jgi:uncharacterized iron-regulated membrane protein